MIFAVGIFLLASAVGVQGITQPTVTTTCSDTGFSPQIVQAYDGVAVAVEIFIGAYSETPPPAGCSYVKSAPSGTSTLTFPVADMSGDEFDYSATTTACGAGSFSSDSTHIDFDITIKVVVAETMRGVITRKEMFSYDLTCKLTRDADASTLEKWTIDESSITESGSDVASSTFTFPVKLAFYTDNGYGTQQSTTFTAQHGASLYFKIHEEPQSDLFIFQVTDCWSTPSSNKADATKDDFFTNMCGVDDTVTFVDRTTDATDDLMKFAMKAFYFTGEVSSEIYFHCSIKICLQSNPSACAQSTAADCTVAGRKRRSALGDGGSGVIDTRTITNTQHILLPQSEVITTQCPENSVYDRQDKTCSSEGVMEVQGVYLDQAWNEKFSDPSSVEFKQLAAEKEFQLYALLQLNDVNGHIRGVKVVRARQGSVILDVQVVYDPTISSSQAFYTFEKAIQGGNQRITNILSLRGEKSIVYIDIVTPSQPHDNEKLTLIVIVVVLAALLFVGMLFGLKLRNMRQVPATTTPAATVKSFENPTMTA